jgi:hypothetical protein
MKHCTHMQITFRGKVLWSGPITHWEEGNEGDDIAETADRLRDGETIYIGGGAGPVFTLVPINPEG